MRNLVKVLVVVFLVGQGLTSCSKAETIAEEDQLYEIQATEGDDESDKPEREN
ncbi:hypothetical protein ACOCEA_04900 [Maribacter sp. CXY002]|uniref:hypothetical protein n=1 Tax=Maribacter luteocoastalis TaxID=3407671 RepID=UPI003B6816AA